MYLFTWLVISEENYFLTQKLAQFRVFSWNLWFSHIHKWRKFILSYTLPHTLGIKETNYDSPILTLSFLCEYIGKIVRISEYVPLFFDLNLKGSWFRRKQMSYSYHRHVVFSSLRVPVGSVTHKVIQILCLYLELKWNFYFIYLFFVLAFLARNF